MLRIMFVVTFLLIACRALATDTVGRETAKPALAKVFFYSFEVERITGIHEDEIERYGCPFTIDKQDFLKALQPNSSEKKYQRLDVRGEVIFSKSTIYFIDRAGIVRLGDKEFLLDKKQFTDDIRPAENCEKIGRLGRPFYFLALS